MGVASLVLGIISALLAFVPFCGYLAFLPALIGLVLGIVDIAQKGKKQEPKGQGIAGVVLNAIAIVIIIAWTVLFAAGGAAASAASEEFRIEMERTAREIEAEMERAAREIEAEVQRQMQE